MTLFAILICIGLQRYFKLGSKSHWWMGLHSYIQAMLSLLTLARIKNDYVKIIATLLPIIILVSGLEYLLHGVWFNLPNFLFNLLVLFFCLDLRKFQDELKQAEQPLTNNLANPTRLITRKLFLLADWSMFSVLFWYILAGPLGALVYVIVNYLALHFDPKSTAATTIKNILDWPSGRIVGLSYALVGHFNCGFAYWRKHALSGLSSADVFAYRAGLAALELQEKDAELADAAEPDLARDLINRALVLWIVAIAVFTLAAWVA